MKQDRNHILVNLNDKLAWFELLICKILIVAFCSLLVVNVMMRYWLNSPIYFAEELAVYILIWMSFLAISVSLKEDTQVRLTILLDLLSPVNRKRVLLLLDLLVAFMLSIILFKSYQWIISDSVNYEIAISLGISKKPFFFIIPVFSTTALFHVLVRIYDRLINREAY